MKTRWQKSLAMWLYADTARTACWLADACGLTHTTIGRYLSGALARPTHHVLRKVCTAVMRVDPHAAVGQIIDHLQDELHASGLTTDDISISARSRGVVVREGGAEYRAGLMDDLAALRQHAETGESVRCLLHDLRIVLDSGSTRHGRRIAKKSSSSGAAAP
jgi:transcriptional regulator with XRE-family HTH domain